jgi:Mg2+-importing ATPase
VGRIPVDTYWHEPLETLLQRLGSGAQGLSSEAAAPRLLTPGGRPLAGIGRSGAAAAADLLLRQFASPIILMLLGAALLSFGLDSPTDGLIILVIVLVSGLLGFWQEHGAERAVQQLLAVVELRCAVWRDGVEVSIPMAEVVPGDVVRLAAGDGIPGDCRLIEERDLCVDEAALTGESFPVEKRVDVLTADTPLAQRANVLHLGTHVVSGSGRAVVVHTGQSTAYGAIADRLRLRSPETEFERGVRRFGNLLVEVTLILIALIFAFNVLLKRPVVDSFLFALALGVGLTPQLLPAIISVNLAQGARSMARRRVIVKRLAAIENFGSMDVLCSDKTGTLTEGVVRLGQALAGDGQPCPAVLGLARLNALFETGFVNPIDAALRELPDPSPAEREPLDAARADGEKQAGLAGLARPALSEPPLSPGLPGLPPDPAAWSKLDEKPFDFHRKRQSVLLQPCRAAGETPQLITKGALARVLEVCTLARRADGSLRPLADLEAGIRALAQERAHRGERVLGVASRRHPPGVIGVDSEQAMTFEGLLVLADPLKAGIAATVAELAGLGVRLKIITGDSAPVAERIAREAGLADPRVLTGADLLALSDAALPLRAEAWDVFAEVEPNQKERLIGALRRAGHVVGYLGDGINDAPALHAADVGLSVQGAVDVAKEAADIVLLEPDLAVLAAGIREGRRTFANTLKYVFMATSANFGNMVSMAGASLLLPFLPLLPKQILLTNLLTDLPEMTIATDRVDPDWINRPRRWDIAFIKRFMLAFGLVSSVFDYLTFAVLLWLLRCDPAHFRTGWFVESVLSAAMVVLVVRTRRPLLASRPSRSLTAATLVVLGGTLLLPFTPLGRLFGFVPLPLPFLGLLALILLAYVISAEAVKRWFYRNHTG